MPTLRSGKQVLPPSSASVSDAPASAAPASVPSPPAPTPAMAPDGQDGMTRAMTAMFILNAAKEEYAAADAAGREALHVKYAVKCRDLARAQGGIYIKAAQFVASLQGGAGQAIVPVPFVEALAELTDNASAQPLEVVAPLVREEMPEHSSELLGKAEEVPVGSASLAQVHRTALGGQSVALKVQYPWLSSQLEADFAIFRALGGMVQPAGYDLGWLIEDVERYVTSELDFTREAANAQAAALALSAQRVHQAGRASSGVLIPAVVACTHRVLVTEFVDGLIRLDNPTALAAAGASPATLGALAAAEFAKLSLEHGLVHGDPHLGNVYARVEGGRTQVGRARASCGG